MGISWSFMDITLGIFLAQDIIIKFKWKYKI